MIALPYVSPVTRKGKTYLRYRRDGGRFLVMLKAKPGTAAFDAEYAAAGALYARQVSRDRVPKASTIAGLIAAYLRSHKFASLRPLTQAGYRGVLDRISEGHGHHLIDRFDQAFVHSVMQAAPKPHAARDRLAKLRILFRFAVGSGMISAKHADPFQNIDRPRVAPPKRATWSAEHDAKYLAHWTSGEPRRAMMLLRETMQRSSDVVRMGAEHLRGDVLTIVQQKTGERVDLPVSPALRVALAPVIDQPTFLTAPNGRPWKASTFGRQFTRWCEAAGIEGMSPHALRRGGATRLIEAGATTAEVAAAGGWRRMSTIEGYVAGRSKERLTRSAFARLETPLENFPKLETVSQIQANPEEAKTLLGLHLSALHANLSAELAALQPKLRQNPRLPSMIQGR